MLVAQREMEDGVDLTTRRQSVAAHLIRWLAASVKPSVKTRAYENYELTVLSRSAVAALRAHRDR
jgi:hypothetical protein